jgi:hypothetical protein
MNLSLLPFPSLAQPDQSVIIDYAQGERLEKGVRCPEGMFTLQSIQALIIHIFQENLD